MKDKFKDVYEKIITESQFGDYDYDDDVEKTIKDLKKVMKPLEKISRTILDTVPDEPGLSDELIVLLKINDSIWEIKNNLDKIK